jgi:hypothetical protein
MNRKIKLTPSLFFGLVLGLFLSVVAFSQAAASIGLAIDSFRPMGGSFFSWRAGQTKEAVALFSNGSRTSSASAERFGRSVLKHAPLTPRSLWLVGKSMELRGEMPQARRAMLQAERISRRDGAVELWLGADRLRNGAIAAGLRHYDLLIRSDVEAANSVIPRMALIIASPEGRRYLAPYIRETNPWLVNLFQVAVTDLPRAAPLAQLLIDRRKKAPNVPNIEQVYNPLMNRLVSEGSYSLALRLYPLLPGANSESLRNVSGTIKGELDTGYPPFIWNFPDSNAQGAEFVSVEGGGTGLDVFGAPGTVGIAGTKLIAPRANDVLFWSVKDRVGNLEGSAKWSATCLIGSSIGTKVESTNMFDANVPLNRTLKMSMPPGCQLVRLDLNVAGGIGRDPASVIIGDLDLKPSAKAS